MSDSRILKTPWAFKKVFNLDTCLSGRGYSFLEPSARRSLVESLCSNFSVLNPSIMTISHAPSESSEDAAYMMQQMHSHRNALKIYSYFLHCILVVEEAAEVEPLIKASSGKVCCPHCSIGSMNSSTCKTRPAFVH